MAKTYQIIVAVPDDMETEELKKLLEEDSGRPLSVLDTREVRISSGSREPSLMEQVFGKGPLFE